MFVSFFSLTLAEYHEQEEIFKLRLGHLKKVCFFNHNQTHKVSTIKINRYLVESCLIKKPNIKIAVLLNA